MKVLTKILWKNPTFETSWTETFVTALQKHDKLQWLVEDIQQKYEMLLKLGASEQAIEDFSKISVIQICRLWPKSNFCDNPNAGTKCIFKMLHLDLYDAV